MKAPVSVIIPCYLCRDTIERAVLSIVRQTMLPSEILLVDDCSPDDGRTFRQLERIVDQYGNTIPVRLLRSEQNCGPGSARNRGWELAGQPFLAFLDADDAWSPRKIEIQYAWMRDNPNYKLTCHGHVLAVGLDANSLEASGKVVSPAYTTINAETLLYSNLFATRTVMLCRNLPFRFKEGKRYAEDYLLWLEILLNGIRAVRIDMNLAFTFKHDFGAGGLSANLLKMEQGKLECYRYLYKHGLIGFFSMTVASLFSLIKLLRRIVLTIQR